MSAAREGDGAAGSSAGAALLESPLRRAIVDELAKEHGDRHSPDLTQRLTLGLTASELAERLDVHVTTIRFHVDQLVEAGLLEGHVVRGGGRGRPHRRFALRAGAPQAPFEVLASLLTSVLSGTGGRQLTPQQAGVQWARARAEAIGLRSTAGGGDRRRGVIRHVADLLGEWGYTPQTELADDDLALTVTLRDCPFLELARAHPDVVCGIHRGLIQGTLQAVGEAGAQVALEPLATPDTCIARLRLADRPRPRPRPDPTRPHAPRSDSS